jgi:hypothetical protein
LAAQSLGIKVGEIAMAGTGAEGKGGRGRGTTCSLSKQHKVDADVKIGKQTAKKDSQPNKISDYFPASKFAGPITCRRAEDCGVRGSIFNRNWSGIVVAPFLTERLSDPAVGSHIVGE